MDESRERTLLRELVQQHYGLVYRFAYRLTGSVPDAEDLTQQTFLVAQSHLHQLQDVNRARGWLCAIARNRYLKQLKKKPGIPSPNLDYLADPESEQGAQSEALIDGEGLQQALNALPEEFRTPLILFYFEEMSYQEMAEHLDVPIGTIMSRLARGKSHLRRKLGCSSGTKSPDERPRVAPINSP